MSERLSELASQLEAQIEDAKKLPGLLSFGPAFLMGLGFFFVSQSARLGLTSAALILFVAGVVCFRFWRSAQELVDLRDELQRMHVIVTAIAVLHEEREREARPEV